MELRQLRYFVEIAKQLHYRRAAQTLNVSQPALSQQIRLLEEELGVHLFVRSLRTTQRRVELTAAGSVLLVEAKKVLSASQHALLATRQAAQAGPVRLGVFKTLLRSRILDVMSLLAERLPQATIKLIELPSFSSVQQALIEHTVDIGLTILPLHDAGLSAIPFASGSMAVLLASEHPLVARNGVSLSQLQAEKWIEIPAPYNPVFEAVELLCQELGFQRHIVQEVSSLELLAELVQLGQGVGLVPFHFNVSPFAGVKRVPLVTEQGDAYPALTLQHVIAFLADNPATTFLKSQINPPQMSSQALESFVADGRA